MEDFYKVVLCEHIVMRRKIKEVYKSVTVPKPETFLYLGS
jgi:hypothetical protein